MFWNKFKENIKVVFGYVFDQRSEIGVRSEKYTLASAFEAFMITK